MFGYLKIILVQRDIKEILKDYKVMADGQNFFNKSVKNNLGTCDSIWRS